MARLLDQYGNPIPPESLTRPVAGPNLAGWRPAAVSIPILQLDPAQLGALMIAADQGDSLTWQMIAAEIERRDMHYLGVLNTRKRVVSQVPITVEPASESAEHKRHAAFVQEWLDTGVLQRATYDMLDAIGKGFSVCAIEWEAEPLRYRPKRFIYRPTRFFEVSYEDGDTVLVRDMDEPGAPPLVPDGAPQAGLALIPAHMVVVHRHPSWSSLTLQSGLTRLVAWGVMFKSFTQRDWAVFCQNYGAPVRVGRYGPDASAEDRAVLWQAVSSIAGDCAAIVPKSMEIEFIEAKSTGASSDMHRARCDWIDAQISKAVLGQTATTDANPGSHAAGQTHRLVQEDIERADCMLLAATINEQVIERMIAFSFGEQDAYPRIEIGRPDEAPNSELIQLIQWAGPQGLTLRAQEIRERFNFSEPEDGDEVVGGRAPPPPVQPPHDLPAEVQPARDEPGTAPAPTVKDIPQPAGQPQAVHLQTQLRELLARRSDPTRLVELMTEQLAERAGAGLGRMVGQVRAVVEQADSFEAMLHELEQLDLDDAQFAMAITQGLEIAELAGQAAFLDIAAEKRA